MKPSLLDRLMSRTGLYAAFWVLAIGMVTALLTFTARLAKEVPPIPERVVDASGAVLYTHDDVVNGKALWQQFDLTDHGSMLGMGAYMGPDYSTEFFHRRAVFLQEHHAQARFGVPADQMNAEQTAIVKEMLKADFGAVALTEGTVTYSPESGAAYAANVAWLTDYLVNGHRESAWAGGVILPDEAKQISAFVDWAQIVASSKRPDSDLTWSNNWPAEPMIDQDVTWNSYYYSLWEFLLLWAGTIGVVFLTYEYLMKETPGEPDPREKPLVFDSLFPSQKKLLKYVPIVALFFFLQVVIGGYLAHLYADPVNDFLIPQSWLPFNVMRALHVNLAIIWVTIGWLVGGMMIAPLVGKEDLRFPWLVDVLWAALLVVGGGGLIGIYLGATGHMRETWFWLGNEGRELLNLGRLWDIGLVVGLVLWFGMVYSTVRKAKENNVLVGTIIWSAFGIATLYIAGMTPIHKIQPNYTVDDYYRWWVVHLWVELTFELFASGVLAFLTVSLGLVSRKSAERVMLFELVLIMASGTLGVGHHYWWQGLDEYWIAIGGLFSALEPLPLAVLMVSALKEHKELSERGEDFPFAVPFLFLAGSAFLNWFGAGFLGMVINTPVINYYAHGTYLIMPHGHVALLGAFGYIALAFIYLVARAHAMADQRAWSDGLSKVGFWLVTLGVVLYALPTLVIGFEQAQVAHDMGYWLARQRSTLDGMGLWMWFRLVPDGMMILGAGVILVDLVQKIYLSRRVSA